MSALAGAVAKWGFALIDTLEAVSDFLSPSREKGGEVAVQNILVWSMDRIGDSVRCTPAIRMLKKRYPKARLTAVVAGRSAPVMEKNPWIDRLCSVRDQKSLKEHLGVLRDLRHTEWDLAVLLEVDERWEKLGQLFCRTLKVSRMAAFDFGTHYPPWSLKVPLKERGSWTDQFVHLAEQLGGVDDRCGMEIHLSASELAAADGRLQSLGIAGGQRFCLIQPGGNFLTVSRQWPPHAFTRLVDLMKARCSLAIVVTGTRGESRIAEEIESCAAGEIVNACGLFSLRELLAVIARSTLLISNDTGPLHIAHALGIPTVAIIGPTSPDVVGIPASSAMVRKDLPCSPCAYYRGWQACNNPNRWECISSIAPEEVLEAAVLQMERAGISDDERIKN